MSNLGCRFMGVAPGELLEEKARVRVWPIPYDLTTSYRPGARFGPEAIIQASAQVERFHDELGWDVSQFVSFILEDALEANAISAEAMMREVYQQASSLLKHGDFLLSLGGEHSVSAPIIHAYHEHYPELHVIQIDAHSDLRHSWQETPYSHACAMRRVVEREIPLTQIGIRNLSEEEHLFLKQPEASQIKTWFARDLQTSSAWEALLQSLSKPFKGPVYLTVDVDGLDPSVIPATGTPEPGGLSWCQMMDLLKVISRHQQVVGADVMELSPMPGLAYAEFATAKLCYQLISFLFFETLNP